MALLVISCQVFGSEELDHLRLFMTPAERAELDHPASSTDAVQPRQRVNGWVASSERMTRLPCGECGRQSLSVRRRP